MTRITVGLDDSVAARLAERAAEAGMTPEEFAARLLTEDLGAEGQAVTSTPGAAFRCFDTGSSRGLRGRAVDDLLAEGFGP